MEQQTPVVYGIANCDTVKKARAWLAQRGLAHRFVDFKKTPPTPELLTVWMAQLDWDILLNRQGTTWRKLSPAQQAAVVDAKSAAALMLAQASVIKRPVIHWSGAWPAKPVFSVGFKPEQWPVPP
ncbi:MAG: arsenate reductase [Burkholderiales bacterium]